MLGIEKYKLNYLDQVKDVKQSYSHVFNEIKGELIDSYLVQWNSKDNEWNEDGPIVLSIAGKQFEFTAYQLSYSLTIDKINLSNQLDWYGSGNEMSLSWNKNVFDSINSILDKKIIKIYGLEFGDNSTFHLVGFEFEFEGTNDVLHLSNGLDCNVLKLHKTIIDSRHKRIEI